MTDFRDISLVYKIWIENIYQKRCENSSSMNNKLID